MIVGLRDRLQSLETTSEELDYELIDLFEPDLAFQPRDQRNLTGNFENAWAFVSDALRMCTIDLHSDTMLVSVKVHWWPFGLSNDFVFSETGYNYTPSLALLIGFLGVLIKYESEEYGWPS